MTCPFTVYCCFLLFQLFTHSAPGVEEKIVSTKYDHSFGDRLSSVMHPKRQSTVDLENATGSTAVRTTVEEPLNLPEKTANAQSEATHVTTGTMSSVSTIQADHAANNDDASSGVERPELNLPTTVGLLIGVTAVSVPHLLNIKNTYSV